MARDKDNPELTDADCTKAEPFREVFQAQHKEWKRAGRPPVEDPKLHIGFWLAPDVVAGIRSSGCGYKARADKVLRDALAKGLL